MNAHGFRLTLADEHSAAPDTLPCPVCRQPMRADMVVCVPCIRLAQKVINGELATDAAIVAALEYAEAHQWGADPDLSVEEYVQELTRTGIRIYQGMMGVDR